MSNYFNKSRFFDRILVMSKKLKKSISESYATFYTWDGKEIYQFEALGKANA